MVALIVGFFVVIGLVGYVVGMYNQLVSLNFNADKSWANIDVLLKQRADELPKLVETCKGYMKHERELLQKITEARAAAMQATTADGKVDAENQLSKSLKTLFAVAENYPDLKANQNFLQLQSRISGLENTIADRREFFNDSVNVYNIKIHQFPDLFMARFMKYGPRHLLQIPQEETKDVKIAFG